MSPWLAVIIPTLQSRPEMLVDSINSAKILSGVGVFVISPYPPKTPILRALSTEVNWVISSATLPSAINEIAYSLPENFSFFSWLGDDDGLEVKESQVLKELTTDASLIIGACRMVDGEGKELYIHRTAKWRLARFPLATMANPIAQPATLISTSHFKSIGGINESLKFAFDHDLFIRLLMEFGKPITTRTVLARYRVHDMTLSTRMWREQLAESSKIRRSITPGLFRPIVAVIEWARRNFLLLRRAAPSSGN